MASINIVDGRCFLPAALPRLAGMYSEKLRRGEGSAYETSPTSWPPSRQDARMAAAIAGVRSPKILLLHGSAIDAVCFAKSM